jgi:uncharacterized protein
MAHQFSGLTFTDDVTEVQREMGSRPANEKLTERGPANDTFGPYERAFIAARDSFYISTISSTGWPYIQFRGGPTGFLNARDDHTLAYADVTGNRQYITTGNLRGNQHAALFLMDYPHQTRLKLLSDVEIIPWSKAPDWKAELKRSEHSRPERVVLLHLAAFDWNCPQHIPQRWTIEELKQTTFFERVESLEQEISTLKAALAEAQRSRP